MKHIIRSKPDHLPFMFQGEYKPELEVVDPNTVKIFQVWTNLADKDMIGPEIFSKKNKGYKNDIAVRLTQLYRNNNEPEKN